MMITKDEEVGPGGDCIIGVKADKSAAELDPGLKRLVASGGPIVITLRVGKLVERVRAWGHPSLKLTHLSDIVVRKSRFTCSRTLAIRADKAAADLLKEFVAALKDPATRLELEIEPDKHRSSLG